MCLAIIALNVLPDWPIIIVANRDELHSRPTLPASPWYDAPRILGGRDLSAGGTWLGMTDSGSIALLTNYREPGKQRIDAPSRGQLPEHYLRGNALAEDYIQELAFRGHSYNGFNLVLGDQTGFWYYSNRGDLYPQRINSGVVGVSNALINTPWPKLKRTQSAVAEHLSHSQQPDSKRLFEIFQDTTPAFPHELPDTGIGTEREKLLSSPFINDTRYGTRCTTLIMKHRDGDALYHEKRYAQLGQPDGESIWKIDTLQSKIVPIDHDSFNTATI